MPNKVVWGMLLLAGAFTACEQTPSKPTTSSSVDASTDLLEAQGARPVTYQGPITITKGGTYSGNWQSLDPKVPAVTIKTDEPVTIENSNIRSRGRVIDAPWNHTKITVRTTRARGLNPGQSGKTQGRFIQTANNDSLIVEHNDLEGTMGIQVNTYAGNRDGQQTIRVRYNRVRNLMGQASDGVGGYRSGNVHPTDFEFANFVQLYEVRDVPGLEIAWNEVVNEPRKSRVEDTINFCRSGGRFDAWARVHDNYIQGGYAFDPAAQYNGAAINTGDCADGTRFGFVKAFDNQVVAYQSGGIGSSAGHDQDIYHNRVVSSGRLADGTPFSSIGLTIWNVSGEKAAGLFENNTAHDNVVGVMRNANPDGSSYRCDGWWPEESKLTDGSDVWCKSGWFQNAALPDPITLETERAEWVRWQQKLASSRVSVGLR